MMHTARIAVRPSSGGRDSASLRRSLRGVAFLVLILMPLLIAPTGAAPRVRTLTQRTDSSRAIRHPVLNSSAARVCTVSTI